MTEPLNYQVPSDDIYLSAVLYKRERSETVILLHGGPGVPDEMTEVVQWLSARFQVINFNQRGIGLEDSDPCNYHLDAFMHDIDNLAAFFAIERFHLFGHSWGGLYAQLYASVKPEKILSLFLCSPASGTGSIWKMTEREIFHYNRKRSSLSEWLGMAVNTGLGLMGNTKAYRNLFRQIIINYHKGFNVAPPDEEKLARISSNAGTKTRSMIKKAPLIKDFGETPFPVMITYGASDAYGNSRSYVFNRFPHAARVIIPLSGHTPWKHNLCEFEKVLSHFYL